MTIVFGGKENLEELLPEWKPPPPKKAANQTITTAYRREAPSVAPDTYNLL